VKRPWTTKRNSYVRDWPPSVRDIFPRRAPLCRCFSAVPNSCWLPMHAPRFSESKRERIHELRKACVGGHPRSRGSVLQHDVTCACSSREPLRRRRGDCRRCFNRRVRTLGTEVCNGADDDCNGVVDEVASTRHLDSPADGASLGTRPVALRSSSVPDGSVLTGMRVAFGSSLNQVAVNCSQIGLTTRRADGGIQFLARTGTAVHKPFAPAVSQDRAISSTICYARTVGSLRRSKATIPHTPHPRHSHPVPRGRS